MLNEDENVKKKMITFASFLFHPSSSVVAVNKKLFAKPKYEYKKKY